MPSAARAVQRRLLCATVFAAAALCAWCAPALAAVEVTIQPPRGADPERVSLDEVGDPEIDAMYTVRRGDGSRTNVDVANGVSVRQLLEQTDTDLAYAQIELLRPNGSTLVLSRKQIGSSPRPGFYTDDSGITRFIGPTTEGGYVNARDHFRVGGAVVLTQRSRSTLTVNVTASKKSVDPGQPVVFKATASGGGSGESYIFNWTFGDGRPRDGEPRMTHTFEKRGIYEVLVTARAAGSERSDPAVVKITVGDPEKGGPDRDGGGTNDAVGAPDSGASDGAGGAGSSYGTPSGGSSTPYTPPATPPSSSPSSPLIPDVEPPPPTEVEPGTLVEGTLLADASEPPSSAVESALRAARKGTPTAEDEELNVPATAWALAGTLALLALGAVLELRQARPRRPA